MMILRTLLGISTFALTASASPALPETCGAPSSGWRTSQPGAAEVVNALAIHGQSEAPRLTWNGSSVSQEQVRQYVGVTTGMNPVPTLLLIILPSADCAQVRMFRRMIDETLDCESGQCVEVKR